MNTLEQQIEKILKEYADIQFATSYYDPRIKVLEQLIALIKQREREAVEGFVDRIGWETIDGVEDDDVIRGRNLVAQMETYLKEREKEDES